MPSIYRSVIKRVNGVSKKNITTRRFPPNLFVQYIFTEQLKLLDALIKV